MRHPVVKFLSICEPVKLNQLSAFKINCGEDLGQTQCPR
jgi:hypothetical protein